MKHYIEIQRLRTQDVVVDDTLTLEKNTDAFIQGDIISITEKIDGANSSIYYDKKLDRLRCFSSKNELDFSNQLRGFLIYVKSLDMGPFIKYPNYIFFGEWLVSHTVIYDESNYNKWYLFSVYDTVSGRWLSQDFVKKFAEKYDFFYPHELYYGPFMSWSHCLSFANDPAYGTQQEGIVIKNQTALEQERGPNKLNEKAEAEEYIRMIVTDARVMKCYHKLVDNGILPEKFELKYMKHVAQNLPKAVYEDCVKEELEILKKAGEFGGKLCSKVTMEIIKDKLKID